MGVRATLPKTGGRKLHSMLSSQIKSQGMKIGRDKLFDFLREEHLLIKTRRKYHKTTNSKHWMRKYPNLIKDIEICMPEQVWVADITYLMMKKKHYYLHLITDSYSKKIVGYQLADNLQAETRLNALKNKYFDASMLRWGAVGIFTTAVDYLLFVNLYGPINSVFIANLISSAVATSINYFTHHRWTFKSEQNHSRSGIKYLLNLTFWWLVSTSIIKTLVVLNIDPKIAKLAPLVLIVPVNYFVLNYLVFKKKS